MTENNATENVMCVMVPDGTDTNGDAWNRCTVHGEPVLGDAYVCEGYREAPYVDPTDDDDDESYVCDRCEETVSTIVRVGERELCEPCALSTYDPHGGEKHRFYDEN